MLSCLTIAPSDKGGDCGPLLRIVPEDAAKSGRRSDEDWAVVWGSGGWHPADIVCAAPGVVRAEAIDSVCSSGSSGCRGAASPSGRVRCFTHDFTQTLPGGLKRTARRTRENPNTALFRRPPPNLFLQWGLVDQKTQSELLAHPKLPVPHAEQASTHTRNALAFSLTPHQASRVVLPRRPAPSPCKYRRGR